MWECLDLFLVYEHLVWNKWGAHKLLKASAAGNKELFSTISSSYHMGCQNVPLGRIGHLLPEFWCLTSVLGSVCNMAGSTHSNALSSRWNLDFLNLRPVIQQWQWNESNKACISIFCCNDQHVGRYFITYQTKLWTIFWLKSTSQGFAQLEIPSLVHVMQTT